MSRILYLQSSLPFLPFAEACLALTPKISVLSQPGNFEIFLDIEPTGKVFGGEGRLLFHAEELAREFSWQGVRVLTDRPEWARAHALSARKNILFLPPTKSQNALWQAPIGHLAACGDPQTIEDEKKERTDLVLFLRKVGMQSIGDFTRLPAPAIGARFGEIGVQLHEWACGKRTLCLPIFAPEEPIAETIDAEDVDSLDRLLHLAHEALLRFESRLRGRAIGAKQLLMRFRLQSQRTIERLLHLNEPLQEAQALLKLLCDFLRSAHWDAPLRTLSLSVPQTAPILSGQLNLFDEGENRFADLAQYIGRLRARYGTQAVGVADLRPSYIPERSWALVWPPEQTTPCLDRKEHRPLFLFSPPRPCSAPRQWRLTPTENLAAEWWEDGGSRQYFIAENTQGERLWVYRDREKDVWFLHGTFD